MGHFAKALKAGIGYPTPGWAPSSGYVGSNISGMPVGVQASVEGISTFSAGIRLIAEDIASLPLITYKRLPQGKERAPSHPAYALLHDSPNPEMTAMVFRETGIGHLYSWGDWIAEKELNGYGVTVRLWPLRPDRMMVEISPETGKRIYKYRLPDGSGVIIPANRIFHVPGFGFDGLRGYSRVSLMRRALESAAGVEEYGLRTFANGAMPGVVLKHPQQLSNDTKRNIVVSWDEAHAGLSNAQRTAILDEGITIEQLGFAPEDAQFLDSRRFSVEEIARGLRLPPHKLSDMSRATFTNIEESNIDYVTGTLGPPAVRIEQQIFKDILGGDQAYFSQHLFDSLLRGKTLERFNAYRVASGGVSWLSGDEIRSFENMNPLPDGQGEVYLAPLNSAPIDMLADAVAGRSTGATQ